MILEGLHWADELILLARGDVPAARDRRIGGQAVGPGYAVAWASGRPGSIALSRRGIGFSRSNTAALD
jgi:hypothetical protein